MMHKRVRGESQAREAAWAAHFLADMFVPYHVTGMPEEEAWQSFMAGTPLGEKETGPAELYSMKSPPPAGWGEGGDFSSALELFFNEYPPENDEGVDWFDPWYFNGWGGATAPGIATGSHGFWEYQAWEWFRVKQVVKKSLPAPRVRPVVEKPEIRNGNRFLESPGCRCGRIRSRMRVTNPAKHPGHSVQSGPGDTECRPCRVYPLQGFHDIPPGILAAGRSHWGRIQGFLHGAQYESTGRICGCRGAAVVQKRRTMDCERDGYASPSCTAPGSRRIFLGFSFR